jgi:hypothetical protein
MRAQAGHGMDERAFHGQHTKLRVDYALVENVISEDAEVGVALVHQ